MSTTFDGRVPDGAGDPSPVGQANGRRTGGDQAPTGTAPTGTGSGLRFRPLHPLGRTTWLAELDGEQVAARPLPSLVDGPYGRADAPSPPLPRAPGESGQEHLIRFTEVAVAGGTPWVVSQFVPGAPLDRLLTVATLTPRQAGTVALEIFAGLAALHAGGLVHGHLSTRTVRVGADGVIRIGDWAVGTLARSAGPGFPDRTDDPATAAGIQGDLLAARRILTDLARNADRPVARRSGLEAELLAGLARMGMSGEPVEAAAAQDELRLLLAWGTGTSAYTNVHAELASLVDAANLRLPAETPRTPVQDGRVGTPVNEARPAPARLTKGPLSGADWHAPNRRRVLWGVAATAAVVAVGALLVTVGPGRPVADRLLHRHTTPTPSPTASAGTARPRAVPAVAPAAAGAVHHVTLHPVTRCTPGKICSLRVTVHVARAGSPRRVDWTLNIYNRCDGGRSTRPGGLLIAAPGAASATATRRLTLPAGRALAVVALTTHPGRAASSPLLVPASVSTC